MKFEVKIEPSDIYVMTNRVYEELRDPTPIIQHYFLSSRPEDLPYIDE